MNEFEKMEKVEKRFLELSQNKDITDEELFEELCYIHAKDESVNRWNSIRSLNAPKHPHEKLLDIKGAFENVKKIRERNPSLSMTDGRDGDRKFIRREFIQISQVSPLGYLEQTIENYEMKQRIRYLEQTLASFMEQTKIDRLSQEALMQSLSNELDEFQEEFYDCQSEVKEQKERIGLIEDALKENVLEPVPFVKDKME